MTKRQTLLSKEQLDTKSELIKDLASKLTDALKSSRMFKTGDNNEQIALDTLMGIGLFTASIVRIADKSIGRDGTMERFYSEILLPSSYEMLDALENDREDNEERLKFS